jgi:hypothetical protein
MFITDFTRRISDAASQATSTTLGRRVDLALLAASLAVVLGMRTRLLLVSDFPINDGGLFLVFVESIARVFPALPATVDYNGMTIPFAYPPIAFWLSAAAVRLGADPLAIVHRVPILMNMAYVLAFAALLLRSRCSLLFTALAVLLFGITLRSYEWLVMGGGLSRGLGSLFLLSTLLVLTPRWSWQAATTAPAQFSRARLVAAGLCVAGAVLSHLEWGMLCAFCALVGLAVSSRGGVVGWMRDSLWVGLTAVAVVAPWLAWVTGSHGVAPFTAAASTGAWRMRVFIDAAKTIVGVSGFLVPFVLLGVAFAIATRRLLWPMLMLAALLLTPRSGATPLVLALGVLAAGGLLTAFHALRTLGPRARKTALATFTLGAGALTGLHAAASFAPKPYFEPLPAELRNAMTWVAVNHPDKRFAVLREAPWTYDAAAEWFPVLARAVNTTTLQGREWLPGHAFGATYVAVEERLNASVTCETVLESLAQFAPLDFVWVEGVAMTQRAQALQLAGHRQTAAERLGDLMAHAIGNGKNYRGWNTRALQGPGTLAGCFDAAGYPQVHANSRVRIFRVPPAPPGPAPATLTQR